MSAAEHASEASSEEQAIEWVVRANEPVAQSFRPDSWLFWTTVEQYGRKGIRWLLEGRWSYQLGCTMALADTAGNLGLKKGRGTDRGGTSKEGGHRSSQVSKEHRISHRGRRLALVQRVETGVGVGYRDRGSIRERDRRAQSRINCPRGPVPRTVAGPHCSNLWIKCLYFVTM